MPSVFEFYPFKRMNDPDEWLLLSLGDDEAAQAMTLPAELRRVVYAETYEYGPAASRVLEFAACLENAPITNDVWMILGHVYGFMNNRPAQVWPKYGTVTMPKTQESLQALLGQWLGKLSEVNKLQVRFNALCENRGGLRSVAPLSAPTVMMFLTGEYLFPTSFEGVSFLEAMREATPLIDQVLRSLDLAPISGRLANSILPSETLRI